MRTGTASQVTVQLQAWRRRRYLIMIVITSNRNRTTRLEAAKVRTYLDQQQQINIFGLWRSALGLVPAPMIDVDTLWKKTIVFNAFVGRPRTWIETDEKLTMVFGRCVRVVIKTFEKDTRHTREADKQWPPSSVATRPRVPFLVQSEITFA